MEGNTVELNEMLMCRERRDHLQKQLLHSYGLPVISFCMNIPGPIKTNEEIRKAFDSGKDTLLQKLQDGGISTAQMLEIHENTGDELLLAADADASVLKQITSAIEEDTPLGRLFDMDVIGTDGYKLSRSTFRRCIICGEPAQECARSRRHSVPELQTAVEELLKTQL